MTSTLTAVAASSVPPDHPDRVLDVPAPLTERAWLPILGPTSYALARLAVYHPGPVDAPWDWLGVDQRVADRAAHRLLRFGWAHWSIHREGTLLVPTRAFWPHSGHDRKLPLPIREVVRAGRPQEVAR